MPARDEEEMQDLRWYGHTEPDEIAKSAWAMATKLRNQQHPRLRDNAADKLALYDPETLSSDQSGLNAGTIGHHFAEPELPARNVVQAGTDTLVSQMIRNKVRPLFVTDGGDAELQGKAEGMTRTVEAGFTEHEIWGETGRRWCKDAAVQGTGWLKCTPDYASARVCIERVFDWEVFTPYQDAKLGKPRQMHHVYPIDRGELRARIEADESIEPARKKRILEAIDNAPAADTGDSLVGYERGLVTDQILVADSWHLPSIRVDLDDEDAWDLEKAKHDGRHCLTIGGGNEDAQALVMEAWPFNYFPLIDLKLIGKNIGIRGRGVPETLLGVQLALNRMAKRIDNLLHLHARPIINLLRRAKINKNLISNDLALILETDVPGGMQYVQPPSVPAELLSREDKLWQLGFEQLGLSQLSAISQKPAGLESGVAMRTVLDTESMRHSDPMQSWEDAHIRLARVYVDCVRLLAEHSGDFVAFWGDERELREISWKTVDMPESKYRLRAWPTNLFSQTPGAKKDEVLTFFRDGLFSKEDALEQFDFPDTRAARDAVLAARRNIERIIERMLRDKKSHTPHPYLNLNMAKSMGMTALNTLEADGRIDSKEWELLTQWLEGVDAVIKSLQPPAPPPGAPPPQGPPPGPPGPPGPAGAIPPEMSQAA